MKRKTELNFRVPVFKIRLGVTLHLMWNVFIVLFLPFTEMWWEKINSRHMIGIEIPIMVNTSSTSGSVTRHSHSADESFAIDEPLQWFLLSPVLFLLSPMSDYDRVDALFLPCRYLSDRGNLLPERSGKTSEQCLASCFSPGLSVLRPDHNAKLHTVLTFSERSLTVCSHLLYHILSCTWVRLRWRQIPLIHTLKEKKLWVIYLL